MTGPTGLEILRCKRCGVAVALVDVTDLACTRCGARVTVPPRHVEALRSANEGHAARAKAAARLEQLAREPPASQLWTGALLMILAPSLSTYWFSLRPDLGLSQIELRATIALPSALPGVFLYVWAVAASGTSARFCDALSAATGSNGPGSMACRSCGAPLAAPAKTHLATCPYCGADNLLREVDLSGLQAALRASLRTLDQALRLLRLRKAIWGLGIAAGCGLALGFLVVVNLWVG